MLIEERLPAALRALREASALRLADLPLPTRKTENWKYSSRYLDLNPALATALTPDMLAQHTAREQGRNPETDYWLTIDNGVPVPGASHLPLMAGIEISAFTALDPVRAKEVADQLGNTLDDSTTPLAPFNSARLLDGIYIRLAAGCWLDKPLYLFFTSGVFTSDDTPTEAAAGSCYPRLLLEAGSNSQITLIEDYQSVGTAPQLTHAISELHLAAGAQVTYLRLLLEQPQVQHLGITGASLQRNATLHTHCIGLGGKLRRHDLQIRLEGQGAQAHLNGVALTRSSQHFDNHTVLEHIATHCTSTENYRYIAAGESHGIFNGRVHIHPKAQKSSARMSNKNLLLSRNAEIDTKPELEIYADDVQCAHGATIGQLDATSLFYLRSRGLDHLQATQLLTLAFIGERLAQIPLAPLRERLETQVGLFIKETVQQPLTEAADSHLL